MTSSTTKTIIIAFLILSLLPFASGCCTVAGMALGGGAGGIIGGGAGLLCGDPAEGMQKGAMIGGTAGAVTGLVCDAVILSPLALVACVLGCNEEDVTVTALSAEDIEKLHKANVADEVIIGQIERVGMQGPLSVKDLIHLQKQGVSPVVVHTAQLYPMPIKSAEETSEEAPVELSMEVTESPSFGNYQTPVVPTEGSTSNGAPSAPSPPSQIAPFFEPVPTPHPSGVPE